MKAAQRHLPESAEQKQHAAVRVLGQRQVQVQVQVQQVQQAQRQMQRQAQRQESERWEPKDAHGDLAFSPNWGELLR